MLLEKQVYYIAEMSSFHHAFDNRLCARFLASVVAAYWRYALHLPTNQPALWTESFQPTVALSLALLGVAWPVRWLCIWKTVNTFLTTESFTWLIFFILLSHNLPSCTLPAKIFGYRNRWKVTPGHHPSQRHFLCTAIAWLVVCFTGCSKQVGTTLARRVARCQCGSPDDFYQNFKALHVMKCPDTELQSVSNYIKCPHVNLIPSGPPQTQAVTSSGCGVLHNSVRLIYPSYHLGEKKGLTVPFFNALTKNWDWKASVIIHIFSKNSGEEPASRKSFLSAAALRNLLVFKIL